ncbi:Uncharacterised protein [Neisseria elongata subsp. glycolytica]|nr:Uncharacterised protein [Neisseria elongata subsp. glycolytica]
MVYGYVLSASIQRSKRQQRMANHSAKYRARLMSRIVPVTKNLYVSISAFKPSNPFSDGL